MARNKKSASEKYFEFFSQFRPEFYQKARIFNVDPGWRSGYAYGTALGTDIKSGFTIDTSDYSRLYMEAEQAVYSVRPFDILVVELGSFMGRGSAGLHLSRCTQVWQDVARHLNCHMLEVHPRSWQTILVLPCRLRRTHDNLMAATKELASMLTGEPVEAFNKPQEDRASAICQIYWTRWMIKQMVG